MVYKKLFESMVQADIDTLNHLIMNGSFAVDSSGTMHTKRQWLQAIEAQVMQYFSVVEESVEIIIKDKKAKLISKNKVDVSINGSRNVWPLALTLTLVKFDCDWKISHAEASTE
ncbi:nuclear transport factor 2 family protein [Macrococcus equi]|uniref:nuclear transport factor 2 family protein n=1 Tax=Macrococcus equi TaxID=3395462 RepID=UPI0039BE7C32